MRHIHPIYHRPRIILDFDSALLLGLHAGDGWISGRWGIASNSRDKHMVSEVVRLVREVLGVEPAVTSNHEHTTTIWSYKCQVVESFKGYGFPEGKKCAIVGVPPAILSGSAEIKRGFLKGLFSADGCFSREGFRGECRLEVASQLLRDGFIRLALDIGFSFRRYSYVHHSGHNRLPLHLAYLGRQPEVIRWMREVGSICDAHQRRFKELISSIEGRTSKRKYF